MGVCLFFLSWPTKNGGKSWQFPNSVESKYNYPFSSSLYRDDPFYMDNKDTIDYESFVVEVKGNVTDEQNFTPLMNAMDSMIKDSPNEIRERQLRMKENIISLMYGLDGDAHHYDDVFSQTMKVLEAYLRKVIVGRVI